MHSSDVIKTARLTEKGTRQGEKYNQYTVVADRRANKLQIKRAVEDLFKVRVVRVNTMNVGGKLRRARTPERLVPRLMAHAGPGSIIVLHDGHHVDPAADRPYTIAVVEQLIPRLRSRGLEFGTVCDETAARTDSRPE